MFQSLWLLLLCAIFSFAVGPQAQETPVVLQGSLQNAAGSPVAGAIVHLRGSAAEVRATTDGLGKFQFSGLAPGQYQLRVNVSGHAMKFEHPIDVIVGAQSILLTMTDQGLVLSAGAAGAVQHRRRRKADQPEGK